MQSLEAVEVKLLLKDLIEEKSHHLYYIALRALEQINFDVSLNSFTGQNAGYLAWIGGGWTYPELRFRSRSFTKTEKGWMVKGTMEMRGKTAPVTINFTTADTNQELVFAGTFNLPARDYFTITPSFQLVPTSIPMEVTLVFDKPVAS